MEEKDGKMGTGNVSAESSDGGERAKADGQQGAYRTVEECGEGGDGPSEK